jgi:parallel beta-helix repeat protein
LGDHQEVSLSVTFTFKLSRRTARLRHHIAALRALAVGATVAFAAACQSDGPTDPAAGAESADAVPTAVPEAAATQVTISPGQNIQAIVNKYPTGTQFLLKAGVYANQRVVPKSGNVFIGQDGAILDGKNATAYAFDRGTKPYPNNVRIQNLIIQNYASPDQHGAIMAGSSKTQSTTGWVVQDCEVRYNKHAGIKLANKMKLLNNHIHHNGQIGISGSGDSVLVEGNEIAFNNYRKTFDFGRVLGGAKFVKTRWLVVRGNYVHDNQGNGLWGDIDNINALYEGNRVENNSGAGIMHEISYDAVIRNNTAKGNGYDRGWVTGAGILISASANVEVYGNTVLDNKQGIVGIQQNRIKNGVNYSSNLKNLYVHHNTVRVKVGGVTGIGSVSTLTFTSRNNRFVANSYDLGSDPKVWTWMSSKRTKSEWQGYGNDVKGSFY